MSDGRRCLPALLLCAALVLGLASPVAAYCRLTTVKDAVPDADGCIRVGIPLSWDRRCFTYTLQEDGANGIPWNDVREMVALSFIPWTNVTCGGRDLGIEFSRTEQTTAYNRPYFNTDDGGNHNAVIFVDDWDSRDHDPRAFALTTVWHDKSNGRIVDGDMEINESRGRLGVCAINNRCDVDSGCQTVDLANVVTHEAGHFLGLAHSDVMTSTMYNSAPVGETCKRTLEEDDVEGICAAYPAGSLPEQCNPTPNGGYGFSGPSTSSSCTCAARSPQQAWLAALVLFSALLARRRHLR